MSVKHNEQFEAEQMEAIQNMGKHENETSSLQMNNSKGGTGEVIRRASSASIAKIGREVCTFSARAWLIELLIHQTHHHTLPQTENAISRQSFRSWNAGTTQQLSHFDW